MLRTLSVRNYVLIDSLEIDFPEGLIIITGQTGAGKSIILGALSLLMGAKGDASAISEGADSCVVEGEFDASGSGQLRSVLEENDVEWNDGSLTVRRVVSRSGRSRSFVNDCPVNVQLLSAISSKLVDIHSQHQSLLLTDRQFQLSMLDFYAGNSGLLSECKSAFAEVHGFRAELEDVRTKLRKSAAEKDYNESQYRQLEAAGLKDGELEELEAEQRQLANAEEIKEALCQVENAFEGDGEAIPSADSNLRLAAGLLDKISRFVPSASRLSERLASVRIELDDIVDEVSTINSGLELSTGRLRQVEDRMSAIYELLKKHSCRTVSELIAVRDRYVEMLYDSSALELKSDELEKKLSEASGRLDSLAAALHNSRKAAAGAFAGEIASSLKYLELERSTFEIKLSDVPVSATGTDAVTFLFSATGQNPSDVAKCASGGELSRIMLSLKALMARYTQMPTMVFDEIDTGVSGSVADKMGSLICEMGRNMQVFAITHLPQVAAKGDAHYLVSKDSDSSGRTVTSIRLLDEAGRVNEVARMLSGSVITDAAVANAQSLLSQD